MRTLDPGELLGAAIAGLEPIGPGRWKFPLVPGTKSGAGVQIEPQWATFRCAIPHASDALPFAAIRQQSTWRGGVKLVPADNFLALRAEVPWLTQTAADCAWVSRQCREVVRGMQAATGHAVADAAQIHEECSDTDPEMLAERCRAGGCRTVVKSGGEVRIDIESRSVRRVIGIARHAQGLRASVALGDGQLPGTGSENLQAVAHFMQRASSSLRFVRAWAAGNADAPEEAGFECVFHPATGDAPLFTAIDALTTACDLFGSEVEALISSTAVARQYLQLIEPVRAQATERMLYRRTAQAIACRPLAASKAVLSSPTTGATT